MVYIILIIIAVILFFIVRKLIGSILPHLARSRNVISGVVAIVLSPLIYAGLVIVILSISSYEYHPERKFTAISWEENERDRHQMSKDLIESKILLNKSKIDIKSKLGALSPRLNLDQDTISAWRYSMGNRGWGFGLKFYYLQIEFENGRSAELSIEEAID